MTANSSNNKNSCLDNDGSSDDDGKIGAMAALLGIPVIILVISIAINILLAVKLKQSRCVAANHNNYTFCVNYSRTITAGVITIRVTLDTVKPKSLC